MSGLYARGVRVGARAAAAAAERIARAAQEDLPGDVRVTREESDVVLSARNLRAWSIDDARLRGFGLLGRRS